jgi:hypothetical protein
VRFGKAFGTHVRVSNHGDTLSVVAPRHRAGTFWVTVRTAWGRTAGAPYRFAAQPHLRVIHPHRIHPHGLLGRLGR